MIPENETEIHKAKTTMHTILCSFRSYSNYSIKFCHIFHEFDGVQLMFDILKTKLIGPKAFRSLIGALLNVARVHDEHLVKWSKTNCVQIILDLVKECNDDDDHKLSSCKFLLKGTSSGVNSSLEYLIPQHLDILLAFVAPDSDIDKFEELKEVIAIIIDIIEKCTHKICTESLTRIKVDVTEDPNDLHETVRVTVGQTIWSLIELLLALTHMAVNDNIKYDIYYTYKMRDHLRVIIRKGSDGEREFALVLLNQLCFDERIAKDILQDSDLLAWISELAGAKTQTQKASQGIKAIKSKLILRY